MRYEYFNHYGEDYEVPKNSGQYEMLNCGCRRKPIIKGRTFLATVRCRFHGKTMSIGILVTDDILIKKD